MPKPQSINHAVRSAIRDFPSVDSEEVVLSIAAEALREGLSHREARERAAFHARKALIEPLLEMDSTASDHLADRAALDTNWNEQQLRRAWELVREIRPEIVRAVLLRFVQFDGSDTVRAEVAVRQLAAAQALGIDDWLEINLALSLALAHFDEQPGVPFVMGRAEMERCKMFAKLSRAAEGLPKELVQAVVEMSESLDKAVEILLKLKEERP